MSDPDRLSSGDIGQLADMHCECLPESLVSRIGPRYAREFYRYVAGSADELCFLSRDGETVTSGCVVSLEPHTLQRRLLFKTSLVAHAPWAIRRLPLVPMARSFVRSLTGAGSDEPEQPHGPEVLLIFTVPQARSRGLGAETIGRCEDHLRSRGIDRYFVKTVSDPGNRAIPFYRRCGFDEIGEVTRNGKQLVLFGKDL